MNLFALLLTLLFGLFILLGTIIVFITKNNDKFISFSLSLAFGVMISLSVFELLPEACEHFLEITSSYLVVIYILGLVLLGMILLKALDHFIPHHASHEGEKHSEKEHIHHLYHIGFISSIALVLHNIIEGMVVYGTLQSSLGLGLLVGLGVGLHNIPMGIVIGSTFYKSNQNKSKTLIISFFISISTFLGGILMILLGKIISQNIILSVLLSITLGMILYIAIFELLEQMIHTKNKKETIIGVIVGVLILVLSVIIGG